MINLENNSEAAEKNVAANNVYMVDIDMLDMVDIDMLDMVDMDMVDLDMLDMVDLDMLDMDMLDMDMLDMVDMNITCDLHMSLTHPRLSSPIIKSIIVLQLWHRRRIQAWQLFVKGQHNYVRV